VGAMTKAIGFLAAFVGAIVFLSPGGGRSVVIKGSVTDLTAVRSSRHSCFLSEKVARGAHLL
jgi:hypothetical protein